MSSGQSTSRWNVLEGDCRDVLATLDAGSVQTCVTSPPYFGLRDYGHDGQIGLEPTPDEFVAAIVAVFREVRRVLRDDGTVWLNLGDSYAAGTGTRSLGRNDAGRNLTGGGGNHLGSGNPGNQGTHVASDGCKPKDLLGIPWMVAFALRADGWYLRSDIIWAKPNPMPESVTDRPTKAHEYLFLLSKSPRYYYDQDATREPHEMRPQRRPGGRPEDLTPRPGQPKQAWSTSARDDVGVDGHPLGRNKRSVWTVATQPYSGAHFATFPPKLIEPCILAGCPEGGTVLDPFNGAGTTGMVALRHNRSYVGIELNSEYAELARNRIRDDAPLLNTYAEGERLAA
jgi:DNA modification methylase